MRVFMMKFLAYSGFFVGGSRIERRASVKGSITLPAIVGEGSPLAPITDSCAFQPFKIKDCSTFSLTLCNP